MYQRPIEYLPDNASCFAEALLENLSAVKFTGPPDIPVDELLQWRRLAARVGLLANAGLDVQAIGAEQLLGAAQTWFQKNKVFVSRCEYDVEVNEQAFAEIAHNLQPDVRWYVTNARTSDARVISLPLGLNDFCNYSDFHGFAGDTQRLLAARAQAGAPRRGILSCFNENTHKERREGLLRAVEGWAPLVTLPIGWHSQGYGRFLAALAQCEYCLCPRGNGLDTHRFWESLYMGAIPIVLRDDLLECQSSLPILVVDRWEALWDLDLSSIATAIRGRASDLRPLTVAYWLGRMAESALPGFVRAN